MSVIISVFQRMFLEGGPSRFDVLDGAGETSSLSASTQKPMRVITVSAVNKVVQLPENKVKLSAYTVPLEKQGEDIFRTLEGSFDA